MVSNLTMICNCKKKNNKKSSKTKIITTYKNFICKRFAACINYVYIILYKKILKHKQDNHYVL